MLPVILIPIFEPHKKTIDFICQLRESIDCPIVIVDDGSGKSYQETFDEMKQKTQDSEKMTLFFGYKENRGKGQALKFGMKEIAQKFPDTVGIVTADGDGQHSIFDILRMIHEIKKAPTDTLLLGVRSFNYDETPSKSFYGNRLTSLFFYLASGTKLEDTQTGLRAFNKSQIDSLLNVPGNRFEYEMNVLLQAKNMGLTIQTLSIETIYENNNEQTHFRAIHDSFLVFRPLITFFMSSIFSAVVDVSLFMIFMLLFDRKTALLLFFATILARVLSGVVNYVLNKNIVFKDDQKAQKTIWKYGLLFCGQMLLSGVGVSLLSPILGSLFLTKLLTDVVLFLGSFSIQKRFIFL